MKSIERRLERLEKAWLPSRELTMTWDGFRNLHWLGKNFPDRDAMPKLLQKEFSRFEAVCRRGAERKAAHPDPPKEPPTG